MESQKGDYVLCSDMTQEQGAIDFLLGLIAEGYEPAIYSSRRHALGGCRAMKQWLVKEAAAHFRAGNDVASATRRGPLDSWFAAGYTPGMEPAEVEAVEAGCWLVRQIHWSEPTTFRGRDGYGSLATVLQEALDQAQGGKGAERHGNGLPFDAQPMQQLIGLYGEGFALGQAAKKLQEATRMDAEAAERELLGAIVYVAGALVHRRNARIEVEAQEE